MPKLPDTTNSSSPDYSREDEQFLRWAALVGIDAQTAMAMLAVPSIESTPAERADGQTVKFPTAQTPPATQEAAKVLKFPAAQTPPASKRKVA